MTVPGSTASGATSESRESGESRERPLEGVRIVDLTSVVAGPYATQILADLGADVIKVESLEGDLMRTAGPTSTHADMAALYLGINRNKRSIALDLRHTGAQAVMHALVKKADAFVTNVRPQGMARLGLDYAALSALAPGLVYVHIVGFGSGGPYAGRQAFDDLVQAASGVADLLPKTERTETPRFLPTLVADKSTGLHAVYGLLAALWQRQRTGRGQRVEVPMLEVTTSFALVEHLYGHTHSPPLGQWGYTRLLTPNRRPFRTKDGFIAIMPYTDQQWPRFFELTGHADLWEQWRGATRQERNKRIDELYATIGTITQERTTDDWMTLLDAHDIPCMRVNRLDDLPSDPHLRGVGFFEPHEHPTEGPYVSPRHPVAFSDASTALRRHPPRLGADAVSVLAEVGMEGELAALVDSGALALPKP